MAVVYIERKLVRKENITRGFSRPSYSTRPQRRDVSTAVVIMHTHARGVTAVIEAAMPRVKFVNLFLFCDIGQDMA